MLLMSMKNSCSINYDLGLCAPRVSKSGAPLPNTRLLSNKLMTNASSEDSSFTALFVGFGQFVTHDLHLTPTVECNPFNCFVWLFSYCK